MTAGRRLLFAVVLFGVVAAGAVAWAEDTQDSPLYAYTLQTALDRMDARDLPAVLPVGQGVPASEAIQAGPVTAEPHYPTVCHVTRTVCPQIVTGCPPNVPTVCPWKTTFCPPAPANGCVAAPTTTPVVQTQCPVRQTVCPGGPTNCPIVRTQCPALLSACPANGVTACPQVATICPPVATQCPGGATNCPQLVTVCPPQQATVCPMAQTQCPTRQTFCPNQVATACPMTQTQCPTRQTFCPSPIVTACPEKGTECPVRQTMCPGGPTNCPVGDTTCPVRPTVCPSPCVPPPGGPQCNFVQPIGDPTLTATAEFSFDANNPGVCNIRVRLTVNAPGIPNIANNVRVCIDPVGVGVGSSALTWTYLPGVPSPWLGTAIGRPPQAALAMGLAVFDPANNWFEVTAVFTGMPLSNAVFGPKKVYAQIMSGNGVALEVQQPIEVFYDRIGLNNPGVGGNAGYNWFYYWKNPVDPPTAVITGSQHDWQNDINAPGVFGFYVLGADHVTMADAASWQDDGPLQVTHKYDGTMVSVDGTGLGPHCCAEVIAHESFHKVAYEVWRLLILASPNGGNNNGPTGDPDDDGVPNMYEPISPVSAALLQAVPAGLGIHTDVNDPDTYNLGAIFGPNTYQTYGDQEMRSRAASLDITAALYALPMGGLVVHDDRDWASPGTNTVPPYDGTPMP